MQCSAMQVCLWPWWWWLLQGMSKQGAKHVKPSGQGINVESEKREPRKHLPMNHGTKEWRKVDGRTPVQVNADHTLHLCMWCHTSFLFYLFPFLLSLMVDAAWSDAWSSHKSHLCWSHKPMDCFDLWISFSSTLCFDLCDLPFQPKDWVVLLWIVMLALQQPPPLGPCWTQIEARQKQLTSGKVFFIFHFFIAMR